MKKIRHFKGIHFSLPLRINIKKNIPNRTYSFTGKFTEKCKYDFKDPNDINETDWMKYGGVALTILDAHKNSVMLGWNYNDDVDKFQLTLYYHEDNKKPNYKSTPIWRIDANQEFSYAVTFFENGFYFNFTCKDQGIDETYKIDKNFVNNRKYLREINAWFGGTKPSPKYFFFYKSLMKMFIK